MSKVTDTRLKEVTWQIMWAGFENGAVGILRRFMEELGAEVVFELDEEKTPACCEYGALNSTEPQPCKYCAKEWTNAEVHSASGSRRLEL